MVKHLDSNTRVYTLAGKASTLLLETLREGLR